MLADLKTRTGHIDVMQLKPCDKMMLGTLILEKKKTARELSVKYGINAGRLHKYAARVRQGLPFCESNGRPTILSVESEKKLVEYLEEGTLKKTTKEFNDKLTELSIETAKSRGLGASTVGKISKRSVGRVEKRLHVQTAKAELGTDASEESCGREDQWGEFTSLATMLFVGFY